jgi:hypothetical protein
MGEIKECFLIILHVEITSVFFANALNVNKILCQVFAYITRVCACMKTTYFRLCKLVRASEITSCSAIVLIYRILCTRI